MTSNKDFCQGYFFLNFWKEVVTEQNFEALCKVLSPRISVFRGTKI